MNKKSVFPERNAQVIPEPEDSSSKEVFAFFGLCMYNAQVLERGLVNLTVGLRLKSLTQLTSSDIDKIFDEMGLRTLGQLIADLRKKVKVSIDLEKSLAKAKKDRNYIAHRFFYIHSFNFLSDDGRSQMIEELRHLSEYFQSVDIRVENITHALWEHLGITDEMVQVELEKMKIENTKKESAS